LDRRVMWIWRLNIRLIKESVASFTLHSPCWGSYILILIYICECMAFHLQT
jgi:hypothetical protein